MNLEQHILSIIYKKNLKTPIKILFPEAENEKIQAVALKLIENTFVFSSGNNILKEVKIKDIIEPVLLFSENENIPKEISERINIIKTTNQLNLAQKLYEIRKEKGLTLEWAQKLVSQKNYYAMMLLEINMVDCLIGGINYNTADILKPALQIIKSNKKLVSSIFIMNRNNETYLFSDCSINVLPTPEQLVEIASNSIEFAINFNFKSFDQKCFSQLNVAMLSYSTNGSGAGSYVDKIKQATEILAQMN